MKVCWFNLNKQKQLRGVVYKLQQRENISQNSHKSGRINCSPHIGNNFSTKHTNISIN